MRERFLSHWRGVLLSMIGIVATLWLALSGQLGLYIHPRYFVFTIVMAVIAAGLVLAAFAILPGRDAADSHGHDHDHDGDDTSTRVRGIRSLRVAGSVLLVVATAGSLLLIPPAALTTATVELREMNQLAASGPTAETVQLAGSDDSSLTVRDWATLLRQGADLDFLTARRPALVGFVTPDQGDPENVFYVARFVVTCCAVDAQPVGVPVHLPGWQEQYPVDSWVEMTGAFVENPSTTSTQHIVLRPDEITPVTQPAQPYVY